MQHKPLNDSSVDATQRQAYLKPELMVFGAVRDLTAGGSGTANESSQGGRKRP